jgi:hypothetical protein
MMQEGEIALSGGCSDAKRDGDKIEFYRKSRNLSLTLIRRE